MITELKKKKPTKRICKYCDDDYLSTEGYGDFCSEECYNDDMHEEAMSGCAQDFDWDMNESF